MDSYAYYLMKKQQGLILTRKNLDPTDELSALKKHSKSLVESGKGISQWDRELGRYRTYEEQQRAVKSLDTSKTKTPFFKMEEELLLLIMQRVAERIRKEEGGSAA